MPETWTEESASIIEGIGDEVLLFGSGFVALFVILLTWLYLSYFNSEERGSQEGELLHQSQLHETRPGQSTNSSVERDEVQNENGGTNHIPSHRTDGEQPIEEPNVSQDDARRAEDTSSHVEDVQSGQHDEEEDCSPEALRQRRLEFYNKTARISAGDCENATDVRDRVSAGTSADTRPGDSSGSGRDVHDSTSETPEQLTVRLKYLNDTERCVTGRQDETLGEFRRRHFADELANRRTVRLIFNGAQLSNDSATLSSCGIQHGCVVHVHISMAPVAPSPPAQSADVDLNLGALMWPLFATILGILWVAYFQYKELFNTSSTMILVGLSGLFCMGLYGQYYPPAQRQAPAL